MAGEPVATIAAGNVFLRLAIPERHAAGLTVGSSVAIGDDTDLRAGRIEKIYPLIEDGRVTADVAVEGLPDTFIGQRMLVRVPVGTRETIAVPAGRHPAKCRASTLSTIVIDGAPAQLSSCPARWSAPRTARWSKC